MIQQRLALGVEYNGTHFHGWQKQSHDPLTLQAALESALGRVAQVPVEVVCAGRTDAGVHATYQVVHFETTAQRPLKAWMLGGNRYLPDAMTIKWVRSVSTEFHARFSAIYRRYHYVLYLGVSRPALFADCLTHYRLPLNVDLMQRAANHLLGLHDFTSFRAKDCQARTATRQLQCFNLKQYGAYLHIEVQADAFLKHMVRNLVGTLLAIGNGSRPVEWIDEVLQAQDRACAGITAPPNGLFLVDVGYPLGHDIPRPNLTMMTPFPGAQSTVRR
jgi:tRNA pseudouridine38-40 synthase